MASRADWQRLPAPALCRVFSFLAQADRLAAADACRLWAAALRDPAIWREVRVRLDDLRDVAVAEVTCTKYLGPYARSLTLCLGRARHGLAAATHVANDAAAYVHQLRAAHVQLVSLQLCDWMYCYRWQHRYKLMHALHRLLAAQRKLVHFTLRNGLFTVGEVRRVIIALACHCRSTLTTLDLRSAFCRPLYYTPRYLPTLSHFNALLEFKVDYSALRDPVLDDLGHCLSLRVLDITVRNTDPHNHCLSNSTWTQLKKRCNLKVFLHVVNLAYYEDVCFLLVPSMPLAGFQLVSGCVWDQRRSRNFRMTLSLLLNHYHRCLERIHLKLKNNMENLDDLVLRFVVECTSLIEFQYEAVLMDFSTIALLCQEQLTFHVPFKSILAEPHQLSHYNRNAVRNIYKEFGRDLTLRNINLKIKDPSRILYY